MTCSGASSFVYNGGENSSASASVWYAVGLFVPWVKVVGAKLTAEGEKFITGQQITASLEWKSNLTVPSPPVTVLGSHRWSISGGVAPFKDYVANNAVGQELKIYPVDKQQATFKFYTKKWGLCDLKCQITLGAPAGTFIEEDAKSIEVLAKEMHSVRPRMKPAPLSWPITTAIVRSATSPSNTLGFTFDGVPGPGYSQGQSWRDVAVTLEAPFGQVGEACFVQLITANRSIKRNTSSFFPSEFVSPFESLPPIEQEVLDAAFPYPYGQKWNISSKGTGGDSPFQPVEYAPQDLGGSDWYRSEAHDRFRTFVMYRPPAVNLGIGNNLNTVWVPIATYEWEWNGIATKTSGQWYLDLNQSSGSVTAVPREDSDFPLWTRRLPSPFPFIPKTW
ncbi:hypothetical protein EON81_12390 [bacterium]|nr:MAG: hypothetical protein EON81_12390 [bacterium]